MFLWVVPLIWGLCRIVGDAMTACGLIALLIATIILIGRGAIRAVEIIVDKEEFREDQD